MPTVRLLLIGGTRFLGRRIAAEALGRGWDITVFHRGQTPNPNPGAREILGDRACDLDRLEGRWDAVVDLCGYQPRDVAASARHLRERVGCYAFISSVSVYPDGGDHALSETATRRQLPAPEPPYTPELFGEMKAGCEDAVLHVWGERALIVRPGLIVGPDDHTDRFGYWVRRLAAGGDVLAPAPGTFRARFIDAGDVAAFVLDRLAAGSGGTYNVQGPGETLTFRDLLARIARVANSAPRMTWVDEAFLLAQGVEPWTELPLWAPGETLLDRVSSDAAIAAGLRFTPLDATLAATLTWERRSGSRRASLAPERERALLAAWRAATTSSAEAPPRPL